MDQRLTSLRRTRRIGVRRGFSKGNCHITPTIPVMKRMSCILPALGFLCFACSSAAQKGMKGLINAEKQFAWFTATHSIKEGFLAYMDSAGVIFRQGNAVNALDSYRRQPNSAGILSWEPAFAVISASGDMGATTGPFEFRLKTAQDTPVGRGTFCSVWRINRQGEWKNLADLGSSSNHSVTPVQQVKEIVLQKPRNAETSIDDLLLLDKKFNAAIQGKNIGAWMPFISTDSWLNTDGQLPATGMLQIAERLQKIPAGMVLTPQKGEISAARDFAFIYGNVTNGTRLNNYLRVWIYRNMQWQVILQTLKWE